MRVAPFDFVDDRVVFFAARFVDAIVGIRPDTGPIRRDNGDIELVDVVELVRLGLGRAGHARQLMIKAKVILDRDRRERLRFAIDLHAFLRLDRLVQTVAPAPARHFPARYIRRR